MAIRAFLSGMITAGFLVGALFFLRFWARSRDLLFLAFCCAFFLLALDQVLVMLGNGPEEAKSSLYVLRFAAFVAIAAAIAHKNRGRARDR